jgi:hypothetical protein
MLEDAVQVQTATGSRGWIAAEVVSRL